MKQDGFWLQHTKGKVKSSFAWPCEIFAQSCEMLQEDENNADAFSILHNHVNLLGLVRNHIFSRFLCEETFRRPLRWCQVSTWPWPINRNLIDSLKNFLIHFLIVELSRFLLYIILYFSSFSFIFSVAKHVLWDQISKHEWLNLIFLGGGRI